VKVESTYSAATAGVAAAGSEWPGYRGVIPIKLNRVLWASNGLLIPGMVFFLWQLAVTRHWVPEQLLPPPSLVWSSLVEMLASGELWEHLSISLGRLGLSLLIGCIVGLLLGAMMGVSRQARAYIYPSFSVLAQFPVIGWVPLLIIFAGIDEALKVAAITIAVVPPVAINTFNSIVNISGKLLEAARVFGFNPLQVVFRLIVPATVPGVFNGLRQGIMQAWLALVFVELLASSEGIGYLMVWGRQLLQMDLIVVSMLVIGLVGLILELLLGWLEKRVQPWQPAVSEKRQGL